MPSSAQAPDASALQSAIKAGLKHVETVDKTKVDLVTMLEQSSLEKKDAK